jgi:hypothetical protein
MRRRRLDLWAAEVSLRSAALVWWYGGGGMLVVTMYSVPRCYDPAGISSCGGTKTAFFLPHSSQSRADTR